MELAVLYGIQQVFATPVLDALMSAFTFLGNHGLIWILVCSALTIMPEYRVWGITCFLAMGAAWVLGEHVVKPLVARPRPFMVDPTFHLIVPPPHGYSFPSGHTITGFAVSTVLAFSTLKRGWKIGSFALATLIAFSRLYLFVHNPTDVLAGALWGAAFGFAAVWLLRRTRFAPPCAGSERAHAARSHRSERRKLP